MNKKWIAILLILSLFTNVTVVNAQVESPAFPNAPLQPNVGACKIIYWDAWRIIAFLESAPTGYGYTYQGALVLTDKATGQETPIAADNYLIVSGGIQYDYFCFGDNHGWIIKYGVCGYTTPQLHTTWIELDKIYSAEFRDIIPIFLPLIRKR